MAKVKISTVPKHMEFVTCLTARRGRVVDGDKSIDPGILVRLEPFRGFAVPEMKRLHEDVLVEVPLTKENVNLLTMEGSL